MFLKIIKRIIHVLANISYLLILIYALVCVPIIFDYKPLVVLSGSMNPTYKVGSVIYYTEVEEDEISEGDVITFSYEEDTYVTHRVISIENGEYETKGDANNTSDSRRITYENIHGKVAKKNIPYIGHYIYFVNQHLYLLIFVVIILLAEFLFNTMKIFNKDSEK